MLEPFAEISMVPSKECFSPLLQCVPAPPADAAPVWSSCLTSPQVRIACRLVALDKCPGVRPVGIGEVVRRIAGKAILSVTGMAVQEVTGALQVCSGQQGGYEATIHAMRHAFSESNTCL